MKALQLLILTPWIDFELQMLQGIAEAHLGDPFTAIAGQAIVTSVHEVDHVMH